MAMMRCPSCGRDVAVSEALYCPFCGQTLRRVFADGSTSAPEVTPAPMPGSVPATPPAPTSSEFAQSAQSAAGWTPYPEQAAFQTAPAREQPASGTAPAAQLIRNQSVVASALAVILIGALLIFARFSLTSSLIRITGSIGRSAIVALVMYSALALAASYWLGWLRLANRHASQVILEAVTLGILILVAEEMLIVSVLRFVGPSYYHVANPFTWWTYLIHNQSLFVWIVALSIASGALGVGFANSCARWSLIRQGARRSTPVADFFTVFATCGLLLAAAAVIVDRAHIGSIFAANVVIVASLVVATLLAVRSGKRRLAKP